MQVILLDPIPDNKCASPPLVVAKEEDEDEEEEAAAVEIDPREKFKKTLIAFYTENDPKYLGKIDYFLEKYIGQEYRILKGLKRKYGKAPAFDISTLPKPVAAGAASTVTSAKNTAAAAVKDVKIRMVTILQQQPLPARSQLDKVFNGANQIESIVTYDVVCVN